MTKQPSPLTDYQDMVERGLIVFNQRQHQVVQKLDHLIIDFQAKKQENTSFFAQIRQFWQPSLPLKGIYLWGTVGSGKTLLLDLFYENMPKNRKKRFHFHEFMGFVQKQILLKKDNKENALLAIGREFLDRYDVLCFDEFYVDHIADAMLLKNLFTQWIDGGLLLVTTSNAAPDQLYKKGVNRELFLPFIHFLQHHMQVEELSSAIDYRRENSLRTQKSRVYTPITPETLAIIKEKFQTVTGQPAVSRSIDVNKRVYRVLGVSDRTIWMDFKNVCEIYASSHDYLSLSEPYLTWFISGIPVFNNTNHDQAKRFRTLIDILYERHVILWLQCAAPLEKLNQIESSRSFFQRTESRIIEMAG